MVGEISDMKAQDFLNKFHLSPTLVNQQLPKFLVDQDVKQSAVLIPLIEVNNALQVLLTKRAQHLKHHPGQISFPGGKVEPTDISPIETALREAHEEIGLKPENVQVIGQLDNYQTLTGFNIRPIVGLIQPQEKYIIDQNEVAEIIQVPLQHFINKEQQVTLMVERKQLSYPLHFMPYQGHNIWGATAAILNDLCLHLV